MAQLEADSRSSVRSKFKIDEVPDQVLDEVHDIADPLAMCVPRGLQCPISVAILIVILVGSPGSLDRDDD